MRSLRFIECSGAKGECKAINKDNRPQNASKDILRQVMENAWPTEFRPGLSLERFQPDCAVDPGRFARGTALHLLAMARHVASTRLVPQANRLGLASHSQAESALVCAAAGSAIIATAANRVAR
jgi:hypothetical protein